MLKKNVLKKTPYLFALLLVSVILLSLACGTKTYAASRNYTNPDTGYYVLIEDDANLLTDAEETKLATRMRSITKYGNAVFKSDDPQKTIHDMKQ